MTPIPGTESYGQFQGFNLGGPSASPFVSQTGWQLTPPLKLITRHVVKTLMTELNSTRRVTVLDQGVALPTGITTRTSPLCNQPDGTEHPIIIPYLTTKMVDDYGFNIEGGPAAGDDALLFETTPGNDATFGLANPPARVNPYVTNVHGGDGVGVNPYGSQPYTNNGVTKGALGRRDKTVKKPKLGVKLGTGLKFGKKKSTKQATTFSSTDPNDVSDDYVTVDLYDQGAIGDTYGDGNELGVNIDNVTIGIVDDKLTMLGTNGQPLVSPLTPGKAIVFTGSDSGSGSGGPQNIVNVELATFGGVVEAGLCREGGDDGNGLMVNLASATFGSSGVTGIGRRLSYYPSFMPQEHTPAFEEGVFAFEDGGTIDDSPYAHPTKRSWWASGYATAQAGRVFSMTYAIPAGTIPADNALASGDPCSGLFNGSGLTIVAGNGNQMAIYLATGSGGGSGSSRAGSLDGHPGGTSGQGDICDTGTALMFGGSDGEGLMIDLAIAGGFNVSGLCSNGGDDQNGLIVDVDGKTIIIDPNGQLEAVGLSASGQPGTGGNPTPTPTTPPISPYGGPGSTLNPGSNPGVIPSTPPPGSTPTYMPGAACVNPTAVWTTLNGGFNLMNSACVDASPGGYTLEAVTQGQGGGAKLGFQEVNDLPSSRYGFFVMLHVEVSPGARYSYVGMSSASAGNGGVQLDGWTANGGGLVWYRATQQWVLAGDDWHEPGSPGAGDHGPVSVQPGPSANIACYIDCAGLTHYFIGPSGGNLTEVTYTGGAGPLQTGSGTACWLHFETIDSGTIGSTASGYRFAVGLPSTITINNFNNSGTSYQNGNPPTPSNIPSVDSDAWQQGYTDFKANPTATSPPPCPYGPNTFSDLCKAYAMGWWDAYNTAHAGDTTNPPQPTKGSGGSTISGPVLSGQPAPADVPTADAPAWQQGYLDHQSGGAAVCPVGYTSEQCMYYLQGWDAATTAGTSGSTSVPPAPSYVPPTNGSDWQAGYAAYVNKQPNVCPSADTSTQCIWWTSGWTAAATGSSTTTSGTVPLTGTTGTVSTTPGTGTSTGTATGTSSGATAGVPVAQCIPSGTWTGASIPSGIEVTIHYDSTILVACGSPPIPIDPATCQPCVRWASEVNPQYFLRTTGTYMDVSIPQTYPNCGGTGTVPPLTQGTITTTGWPSTSSGPATQPVASGSGSTATTSGTSQIEDIFYNSTIRALAAVGTAPPLPIDPATCAAVTWVPGNINYAFLDASGNGFNQTQAVTYPTACTAGSPISTVPGVVPYVDASGTTWYRYRVTLTTLTPTTGAGGSGAGYCGSGFPVGDARSGCVTGTITSGAVTYTGFYHPLTAGPTIPTTDWIKYNPTIGTKVDATSGLPIDPETCLAMVWKTYGPTGSTMRLPTTSTGAIYDAQTGCFYTLSGTTRTYVNPRTMAVLSPQPTANCSTLLGLGGDGGIGTTIPPSTSGGTTYGGSTGTGSTSGVPIVGDLLVSGNEALTGNLSVGGNIVVAGSLTDPLGRPLFTFPTTQIGDLLVGQATPGKVSALHPGAEATYLQIVAGLPVWAPIPVGAGAGLPAGGVAGQALLKNSSTDYNAIWALIADANISDVASSKITGSIPSSWLGATSTTAAAGNDSRLSNARTPTAHEATHIAGGSDPLAGITVAQLSSGVATSGYVATANGSGGVSWLAQVSSGGTVTSVGLSLPSIFSVSGSPIIGSGTLTATLATEVANAIFAGPSSGADAAPTFRALVAADLPLATVSAFGAVKPDGSTITISAGVISSSAGSGATVATTTSLGTVKVDNNGGSSPVAITKAGLLVAAPVDSLSSLIEIGNGAFNGGINSFIGNANGTFLGINAATSLPYPTAVLADSPIVYYRLNDATATMVDASGNGYNGTYINTYTLQAPGATNDSSGSVYGTGKVAQTAGISSHLPSGNAARTVELIIKMPFGDNNADGVYIDYGSDAANQDFFIGHSGNGVNYYVGTSTGTTHVFQGGASLDNGAWHHLAVTYDGTTMTAYHNGSAVGTWVPGALNTVPSTIYLGGDAGNHLGNSFEPCYTDEVAIYGTALSSARILAHYNAISQAAGTYGGDWLDFQFGGIPVVKIAGNGDITAGKFNGIVPGAGTVSSVGLTVPSILTVTGSPVTNAGTLAVALATQAPNLVLAGPTSGANAAPTMRALVAADLPLATTGAFGAVKPDGTSITIVSGVISSTGGGGGSGTGASVNKVQLDYALASDIVALSIPASTWTDLIANQSFTVDDAQSLIEVEAIGACLMTTAGLDRMGVRAVIDSAGTPITKTVGESLNPSSGTGSNPFSGASTIKLSGLSAGTHTIKFQAYTGGSSGAFYCRPVTIPTEALTIAVIERKVVATGASGSIDAVRCYFATQPTITSATETALQWDTNDTAYTTNSAMHSTSANKSRIVFPTAGKYIVGAQVKWTVGNTSGVRQIYAYKNGDYTKAITKSSINATVAGTAMSPVVDEFQFAAGDYIEWYAYQTSGSSLTLAGDEPDLCSCFAMRVDGYMANVMTQPNDLIIGTTGGAPQRLAAPTSDGVQLIRSNGQLVWGNASQTGASVNKVQLDYAKSSDTSALSLTATTWVDIEANQTFTVDDSQSTVEILVRGLAFIVFGSATTEVGLRMVIDSGSAPQNINLGGAYTGASGNWTILQGIAPVLLSGLSAGSHTVKLQAYNTSSGATMAYYCRPVTSSPVEFLSLKVIERKVVPTGLTSSSGYAQTGTNSASLALTSSPYAGYLTFATATGSKSSWFRTTGNTGFTVDAAGLYRLTLLSSGTYLSAGAQVQIDAMVNGSNIASATLYRDGNGNARDSRSIDLVLANGDGVELRASAVANTFTIPSGAISAFLERVDGQMMNPMILPNDTMIGGANGLPTRLAAPGANKQLNTDAGGNVAWQNAGMVKIAPDVVLATTQASITFSSIPSGYRHLMVVASVRGDGAFGSNVMGMRFNGDSGANYYSNYEYTRPSSVGYSESLAATSAQCGDIIGATAGSTLFSALTMTIQDYTSASHVKTYTFQNCVPQALTTTQILNEWGVGMWNSASGVTSITFIPPSGNFAAGTVFSLFGIGAI